MRLVLQLLNWRLCISAVPDGDDADAGPGASALLDQAGPYGFAPPEYWTDDPDEPEPPDEW